MLFENFIKMSDRVLLFAGFVKLALLVAFFASFAAVSDAQARSAEKCEGINLLEQLKADDPAAYDAVIAEASQVPNNEAIFWKLEKEGQEPSWLYGTMHLADPEISTIPEDAKEAILASDSIVIESVEALDPEAAAKAMGALAHLTFLTSGNLRDFVDDDLEDDLAEMVAARGIPMQLAERMRPWLIATTISLPICEFSRKQGGAKVLDNELADFAVENGKGLKGLESMAEQLNAMASISQEYHVATLNETIASRDKVVDMVETMKILYKQSNIGAVLPLMKNVLPDAGNSEGTAQFQRLLIDKRNVVMFERSLPILEQGTAFIAVGALHLSGETGLVKQFRDAGFTVTAVR